jgi:hypothetical protein
VDSHKKLYQQTRKRFCLKGIRRLTMLIDQHTVHTQ